MFSDKTTMFSFIIIFWMIVFGLFTFAGVSLTMPDGYNSISANPATESGFMLMIKIMFFALPAGYDVPFFIPLILDSVLIFSIYVFGTTVFGVLFKSS